jgi:hypothetical protein
MLNRIRFNEGETGKLNMKDHIHGCGIDQEHYDWRVGMLGMLIKGILYIIHNFCFMSYGAFLFCMAWV